MRKTLANLEREETAITEAFTAGAKQGLSMRQHLNNIRRHSLYEACGCDNFEQYCKEERLPFGYGHAKKIAANGEVEQILEKAHTRAFSDRALTELSKLRAENEAGKRTHEIDATKVKKVVSKLPKNGEISAPMVKEAIEKVFGPKEPRPFGEQLQKKVEQTNRLAESLRQLDEEVFLDAEKEYPGVVKRLAKAYSDIASLLRRSSP